MLGRHIQVSLKKDKPENIYIGDKPLTKNDIKDTTRDVVKYVSGGIIIVMTAATVLNTASQVIINKSKTDED